MTSSCGRIKAKALTKTCRALCDQGPSLPPLAQASPPCGSPSGAVSPSNVPNLTLHIASPLLDHPFPTLHTQQVSSHCSGTSSKATPPALDCVFPKDRAEQTKGPGYKGKVGGGPHSASLISASSLNASLNPAALVPCLTCSRSHPVVYSPLCSQD